MAKNKILTAETIAQLRGKPRAEQADLLLTTHGPLALHPTAPVIPEGVRRLAYLLYLAWYSCRKTAMMQPLFPSDQLTMVGNRARALLSVPTAQTFAHRLWRSLGSNLTTLASEDLVWVHDTYAKLDWRKLAKIEIVNEALGLAGFLRETLSEVWFDQGEASEVPAKTDPEPATKADPEPAQAPAKKGKAQNQERNQGQNKPQGLGALFGS